MTSEEIVDAFRKVTEVYEYVDNLIFDLDNICEGKGFKVPDKIPRILKFSYNVESEFIKGEWEKIHSIIKIYQPNTDKDADKTKDKHLYGVATLFDFCYFCNKPLLVIAKYTCDANPKPQTKDSYTTFWMYYWPIQRRIHNEFDFEDHTNYFISTRKKDKYIFEKTIFKEFDLFEFLCNNTNPEETIEKRIFNELNEIQKLDP